MYLQFFSNWTDCALMIYFIVALFIVFADLTAVSPKCEFVLLQKSTPKWYHFASQYLFELASLMARDHLCRKNKSIKYNQNFKNL